MYYRDKSRNPLNDFLRYVCYFMVFICVNLIVMLGVNCADSDNCLRGWCSTWDLKPEFSAYISKNCNRGS